MIELPSKTIWLVGYPIDFRKSLDGLCIIITEELKRAPQEEIIIFHNRRRDRLKIVFWDENGYAMIYKKIAKGKFILPKANEQEKHLLDNREFTWLMQGVNWLLPRENQHINYHCFA